MSENQAVEAVREKALVAWRRDKTQRFSFQCDAYTYANGKRPSVLVAIATKAGSVVMAADMADWLDPQETMVEMILSFMGLKSADPTAMQKAVEQKAALPVKR